MSQLKITLAQINSKVGDITINCEKIIAAIKNAKETEHTDLIVFPELALTGYPPEDLLHRHAFFEETKNALHAIKTHAHGIDVLLGYPEQIGRDVYNAAAFLRDGQMIAHYRKHKLPNYSVFDEQRYFKPGNKACVVDIKGIRCGICICEDIWFKEPILAAKNQGAQCIISINASPYSMDKTQIRKKVFKDRLTESGLPLLFVNTVGGQDELVFDGGSQAIDANGTVCAHAGFFEEKSLTIEIDDQLNIKQQPLPSLPNKLESIYQALVLGVRDYVLKNRFPGVIIGLSGGIDSALTLAIAVDALGADKVTAVMMPSQYTASMSEEDAASQATWLGVDYKIIPIKPVFDQFLDELAPHFKGLKPDVTEENIQARIRGTFIMALSNKTGKMVLTTGNKSEMAVGYATLYGDMAGGFAVLKDVFKTLVYALSRYRNELSKAIPERVITRPPSAELAEGQVDQDSLPDYDTLDKILKEFIELDKSIQDIINMGFDEQTVKKVARLVVRSEYKRRQAPPGPRITEKAFGRDRRYPITCGFSF